MSTPINNPDQKLVFQQSDIDMLMDRHDLAQESRDTILNENESEILYFENKIRISRSTREMTLRKYLQIIYQLSLYINNQFLLSYPSSGQPGE